MDFITPRIAIGDRHEAADLNLLSNHKIDAVLNLAYDLDISYYDTVPPSCHRFHQLEYQKIGLIDGPGNQPTALAAAVYMLDELLGRNQIVFVHCHAGVSRSATVVATYLSHKEGMSFDEALVFVQSRRWRANPNPVLVAMAKSMPNLFEGFGNANV